jgi:hypothetical protein
MNDNFIWVSFLVSTYPYFKLYDAILNELTAGKMQWNDFLTRSAKIKIDFLRRDGWDRLTHKMKKNIF